MDKSKIRYEIACFKKVVKNMDNKEIAKEIAKEDAGYEECDFIPSVMEYLCRTKDKYFEEDLADWIDLVENADLHKALKSLTVEEQTLLGYLYFKEKTQSEMAKICKAKRQTTKEKLTKTISKTRSYLCNK